MFLSKAAKLNVNFLRGIATSATSRCQATTSSGSNPLVLFDIDDKTGYATLTLNRAPANSFNLDLLTAFSKALDEVVKNKSRGMILTSVLHLKFHHYQF